MSVGEIVNEFVMPLYLDSFELFLDLGKSSLPVFLHSRLRFVGEADWSIAPVWSCDFDMELRRVLQSDLKLVASTSGTHTRSLPERGKQNPIRNIDDQ